MSLPEKLASYVLHEVYADAKDGNFALMGVGEDSFSIYKVVVEKSTGGSGKDISRLKIVSAESYLHDLKNFWSEPQNELLRNKDGLFFRKEDGSLYMFDDSMFEQYTRPDFLSALDRCFREIPEMKEYPVYVYDAGCHEKYSKIPAVQFLLQKRFENVIELPDDAFSGGVKSLFRRVIIPPDAFKKRVAINPSVSLADLIFSTKDNAPLVAFPMTEEVLSADLVDGVSWNQICQGKVIPDFEIDGIGVTHFTLKADIDGYQNIYLNVYGMADDKKPLWRGIVRNAMNVVLNKVDDVQAAQPLDIPSERGSHTTTKPDVKPANGKSVNSKPANRRDNRTENSGRRVVESTGVTIIPDFEGEFRIVKDRTGYSFKNLFESKLQGAETIVLEHSYLYKWYQIYWIEELIKLILRIDDCKRFILITNVAGSVKEEDGSYSRFVKRWEKSFKTRGKEFVVVDMPKCHDRILYSGSDWRIRFGYGLDFRAAPTHNQREIDIEEEKMPATRDTYIDFHKFNFKEYDFKTVYANFPDI